MFWLALATQLTAPIPLNFNGLFTANDVPDYLLHKSPGAWGVPVQINVAPDGTIRACDVTASSGIADLDKHTCKLFLGRAKFEPARSVQGVPTYGVYRTTVFWFVADTPRDTSKVSLPDVDLTVQRLPKGLQSPTLVEVMFAVDVDGQKTSCAAFQGKGLARVDNHLALVPIACEQVLSGHRPVPVIDATGQPIASIQNALVRFSLPKSD